MILVKDQQLAIDVLDELEPYPFHKARNRGTELTSCSPFRSEDSPSFSINLETGQWIDFGTVGDARGKGNLISLLAFLRNESYEDTEMYLIHKYGIQHQDMDTYNLEINLEEKEEVPFFVDLEDYKEFAYLHPYLSGRGVSEKVQRAFKCGFDKKNHAVAFPWFDKEGRMVNVKFRSIRSKHFHYLENGQPIRNHLYGIHFVRKMNKDKPVTCYIVESEIDAMYLWTHGLAAVAIGGSNLTNTQISLLRGTRIDELVIATDADEVGRRIRNRIIKEMVGYVQLTEFVFPEGKKDVNDLTADELKLVNDDRITVNPFNL